VGPSGPSFSERVAENKPAAGAQPSSAATGSPQDVIADLRAGRISPDVALSRLTDLAVKRSGAPDAMRPRIESQVRNLLATDPLVQDLIKKMGAAVPTDE
jgi:hypothetical protein